MLSRLFHRLRPRGPAAHETRTSVATLIDGAVTMAELAGSNPHLTPVERATFRSVRSLLDDVQLVIAAGRCEEARARLESVVEDLREALAREAS